MRELEYTRSASPSQFVGRASEVAEFYTSIELFRNGNLVENTIVITGPPGIGKSSFLNFITQRKDIKFLRVNMKGGDISNLFHTSFPIDKRLLKVFSSMQKFYVTAVKVALNITPASPLTPILDLIPEFSPSEEVNIQEILRKEDKKLEREGKKLVIVLDQAETLFLKSTYCPQFLEKLANYTSDLPNILLCIGIQLRFNGPLWHKCPTIASSHKTIEISQLKNVEEVGELIEKRVPHIDFDDEVISLIYDCSGAVPLDVVWITSMLVEGEKEVDKKLWDTSMDKISSGYQRLLKEASESTEGLAKKIYEFLNSFEADKFATAKTIAQELQEDYEKVRISCTIMEDRGLLLGSEDGYRIFRGEHFLKGRIIDRLVWEENENRIRDRYAQAFLNIATIAGELGTEVILAMTKLRESAVGIYTSEIAEMTMHSEEEIEKVCSKLAEMRIVLRENNQYRICNDRFYDWLYEEKLNKEEKQIIAFKTYSRVFQTFRENNNFEGMNQMLQLMIDEYERVEMENSVIDKILSNAICESLESINRFMRIIDFRGKLSFLEQLERVRTIPWETIEDLLFELINLEFREGKYENALVFLERLGRFYEEIDSQRGLLGVAKALSIYGKKLENLKPYKLLSNYKLASDFFEEASFLFEKLGRQKELHESLTSIRKCLAKQARDSFEKKNYYDCIRLLERVMEISEQLEDDELIRTYRVPLIESYLNQAEIDKNSGHYDLSFSNLGKAYELSGQTDNEKCRMQALIGMGILRETGASEAVKNDNLEEAIELLENAKEIYFDAKDKNKEDSVRRKIEKVKNIKMKRDRSKREISKERIPVQARSMFTRVITIASGKGGTGKTTTTANLGTALALLGQKTIILDADIAMANLALILGMEKSKVTIHEVLAGEANIKDAMYKGPGGVIVVPCGLSLTGFQKSDPEKLQDIMIELLKGSNFLLIDAPPGLTRDAVIPLAVADEVILVVNPDISSMADAFKTKLMTEMVGSRVSGVILNRANFESSDLTMREVEKILDVKILEVIPNDWEVRRSAVFKVPIVVRSEYSPAAVAFRRLASKLVGERFIESEFEREEGIISRFVRSIFGE